MERKITGLIPRQDIAFSVFNPVIMIVIVQCAYSVLVVLLIIIDKYYTDCCLRNLHLRNVAHRGQYLKRLERKLK